MFVSHTSTFIGLSLMILIIFHLNFMCGNFIPDPSFEEHYLTIPNVYHAIHKRQIVSSKKAEQNKKHLDHLCIELDIYGIRRILDLRLNRDLISKNYFEKHQKDGDYVIRKPQSEDDVELCHYNGDVRSVPGSWVALSTCQHIRGMLYDGNEIFYIESAINGDFKNNISDLHVVYKLSDLKSNFSCGVPEIHAHSAMPNVNHVEHIRTKRNTDTIRGPYNSDKSSRYIELVLVVDNSEFKHFNEDTYRVHQHCKDIANIINSIYTPLNIFVALVGVEIWSNYDEIYLEVNGDKTLTNFLKYRREHLVKDHPNDNAQLLTRFQFEAGVVGKALKGPICTFEYSGGVNMDHSSTIGLVATTIAHEMGHNLGMEHDTENCKCPHDRCIMSPSSNSFSPTEWSSCSREYLAISFEHGMDYCLRNKPTSLFEGPVCGNGFVESGEQCDCGLQLRCDNPCCNATTCMLHGNASCATGKCCDFQTCRPKTAGTMCRSAEHVCDLPEYCDGYSEYCPNDVFKIDGEPCERGLAFCYQGNCRNHNDQCRILWGPSGTNSDPQCYDTNMKGSNYGNCGYNKLNQTFTKCRKEDVQCGMLQCRHFNEKLEFGMESVSIIGHSFITVNNTKIVPCRTAIVDMGLNEIDPGLVPDGSKCGENQMCYNQRCMPIEALRNHFTPNACPHNCNGNGVCNSKGHCHCNNGFAPPSCEYSGVGGSEDSGPAENSDSHSFLWKICFYMIITVVSVIVGLFLYSRYIRRSTSQFWKRDGRRTIQKSFQVHVNRNDSTCNINGTGQSLLSTNPKVASKETSHCDSLIGSFPGFSITPIPNKTASSPLNPTSMPISAPVHAQVPIRPAPTVTPVAAITVNPPLIPSTILSTSSETVPSERPAPPPVPRSLISSPVLDNTTSLTVKKLIDRNLPVRPAPPVPLPAARNERPTSTPDMLEEITAAQREPSRRSDEKSMTLGRLPRDKDLTLPSKAAKIDKETLKKLIISDPIPLNEPNIPVNPLPLSKDQEKCVVMRVHSLRQSSNKQRSKIQSFGSMRLANSHRPISSATCLRPTSPPPCPPLQGPDDGKTVMVAVTGAVGARYYDTNEYDQTGDNIYAVIDEGPEDLKFSPLQSPSCMGSNDGLLNEIVNEIQARNKCSIYSNQETKENDQKNLYENTEENEVMKGNEKSSSSEYLKPITTKNASGAGKAEGPKHTPLKVPDKSAPGYKPFNSFEKSVTPLTKPPLSQNSSQEKRHQSPESKGPAATAIKSSVAAVANRFNTASGSKPIPAVVKPLWRSGNIEPTDKSSTSPSGSTKHTSVASIQKKFEAQLKTNSSKFTPVNKK